MIPVAAVARPRQGIRATATGALPLSAGSIVATAGNGQVVIAQGVAPQGGMGTYTRQLEHSENGVTGWAAVTGATVLPHIHSGDAVVTGDTDYYRLVVSDGVDTSHTEVVSATPTAPAAGDTLVFSDNLSTGDYSKTGGGFSWGAGGGSAESFVSATNPPPGGTHSIHFPFAAGAVGTDYSVERRFQLPSMSRLAIRFRMWLPAHYFIRNNFPASSNNKLLALYGNSYADTGTTSISCVFEIERTDDLTAHIRAVRYDDDYILNTDTYVKQTFAETLVYAEHAGTWVDMRFEVTTSSGAGATDGRIRVWRNGALTESRTNLRHWFTGGDNLYKNGYLMGWANSGFDQATTIQITDFELHNSVPASWEVV